jgi:hypothetical protein
MQRHVPPNAPAQKNKKRKSRQRRRSGDSLPPLGWIVAGGGALVNASPWGWGFSTSQDLNGDIALIACFASSWTPAMVRRWHADPFGFLRPWGEVPPLMAGAPPAIPRPARA